MHKSVTDPLRFLKGIGPKRAEAFSVLGLNTIEDLLYFIPRRYEDRTHFSAVKDLKIGEVQTLKAGIMAKNERRFWHHRGLSITEISVGDETGRVFCVWFNQPYLGQYFKIGDTLILYGKVELYNNRLQITNPEFEIVSGCEEESLSIGRVVPIYSLPKGVGQRSIRRMVKHALDEYLPHMQDFIPYDIRSKNNLPNLAQSLINIHFPVSGAAQNEAYRRLSFEEFFLFQVPLALRKKRKKEKAGIPHKADGPLADGFMSGLPFKLTASQEKVMAEIRKDMSGPEAMQRLLQGDVGSGKTVVAAYASVIAIQGGYQAAFMVPTEILAKQHYEKIAKLMEGCSSFQRIRIALLTSSLDKKEKEKACADIKGGKIDLVIGTHALLEEKAGFKNLGLVIIDEQHKFGVGQRALLPAKGPNPDVLIMTATPIPRTLAITIYGDLDLSVITELPPGRLPVKTMVFGSRDRDEAYAMIKSQLKLGRQAYIIYPVIEESCALDISGAKAMYEELKKGGFRDYKLGLVHGRLKDAEQDEVMLKFKNKELDMLVATTVLEVGIDIANATCMAIEHAERFGLSSLHQLRGRIGRGPDQSYCVLISDAQTEEALLRQEALVRHNDGFRIAEEDLKIRGPGEFFGRVQHGLTELKIGNPLAQIQLLKSARDEAINFVASDPGLSGRQSGLLKEKLLRRFPEYEKMILVG